MVRCFGGIKVGYAAGLRWLLVLLSVVLMERSESRTEKAAAGADVIKIVEHGDRVPPLFLQAGENTSARYKPHSICNPDHRSRREQTRDR